MKYCLDDIKVAFNELYRVLEPSGFGAFLDTLDWEDYHTWRNRMYCNDYCEKYELSINSGCTRVVLIPHNEDFVFKIQYEEDNIDYCQQETDIYNEAERRGIGEYFAWSVFVGKYGAALVYAMEKVDADEYRASDDSFQYHVDKWCEETGECGDDYDGEYDDHDAMIEFAVAHNGGRMREVEDFIVHLGINDLHAANWGYRGDTLVLIDYGGYNRRITI